MWMKVCSAWCPRTQRRAERGLERGQHRIHVCPQLYSSQATGVDMGLAHLHQLTDLTKEQAGDPRGMPGVPGWVGKGSACLHLLLVVQRHMWLCRGLKG